LAIIESIRASDVVKILDDITSEVVRSKDLLTELDSVGGDGDHGVNLERGFLKVRTQLLQLGANSDVGAILSGVGATILATVGGATGSLYGAAFMKAGAACRGKTEIKASDVPAIFNAALNGMKDLGGAKAGDKTMLDVMIPATEAAASASLESSDLVYVVSQCAKAAREGLERTKSMAAKKGRAMYLGERTVGHYDVGATSLCLMIESAARTISKLDVK
jgi:phosphoenolpyruvate---glycerone phosphotransferase subunit DhaL